MSRSPPRGGGPTATATRPGRHGRPLLPAADSPRQTPTRIERRIIGLRVSRRWGPARIAYRLRHSLEPSTVHKILHRYGCPRLAWTDPATGVRITCRPKPHRYEHAAPGDLVHVDIKKLGRIPDGGGHRVLGRRRRRNTRRGKIGYCYIHNAVDDHTRLAYSEILTDERKETAVAFWLRAKLLRRRGITVTGC